MQLDEFEKLLINIQNNTFQTKILQAVFTLAKEVNEIKNAVFTIQNKVNDIITEVNEFKEKEREGQEDGINPEQ